jgi:soluble lytic murein transglycosylase
MQIMPATALSLSRNLGVTSESDVRQQLQKAEFNIAIGSRYLEKLREHYRGFYPAVFAGYNAGEYAVDRWMKARHHVDPLIWVELIPFLETRNYVKNTWRNLSVYKTLYQKSPDQALLGADWLPNHKSIAKSVITAQ